MFFDTSDSSKNIVEHTEVSDFLSEGVVACCKV